MLQSLRYNDDGCFIVSWSKPEVRAAAALYTDLIGLPQTRSSGEQKL